MSVVESLHERWQGLRREIERLPDTERYEVANGIISDLRVYSSTVPKKPLKGLLGLLSTGAPPPSDEEVAGILEEERMKKYGA